MPLDVPLLFLRRWEFFEPLSLFEAAKCSNRYRLNSFRRMPLTVASGVFFGGGFDDARICLNA